MKITTVRPDNVIDCGEVSAVSAYGIGFFTGLLFSFANLLGIHSGFLSKKITHAKDRARNDMIAQATALQADGVMDVKYQLSGLSVLAYGTAFRLKPSKEAAAPAEQAAAPVPGTVPAYTAPAYANVPTAQPAPAVNTAEIPVIDPEAAREIEKYQQLVREGVISAAEFNNIKAQILMKV